MARKSKFRLFIVILLAVLLFLAVLAGGGLFFLNRYLNSSGFLDKVRQEAQSSLGLPVRMETLRVSIFSGLSVRGFSLASPVAGNPPLVRAEKIKISYRLRPLLDRKVQVDEILLVSPRFDLRADERGELELPRKPAASHPRGSKERSARKKKEPAVSSPWTVEIKNLRVKSASGSFRGPDYTITVSGMNLDTSLRYTAKLLYLSGRVQVRQASLNGHQFLRAAVFPFQAEIPPLASGGSLTCKNFSARLYEGGLTGEASVRWKGPGRALSLNAVLSLRDLKSQLIWAGEPAPVSGLISGRLKADGDLLPNRRIWPEVSGRIVSRLLRVKSLGVLTDLSFPVSLTGGELKTEPITADLAGGEIEVKFKSDLNRAPLYPFAARLVLSNLNLAELLKANPELRRSLGSKTILTGYLSGEGSAEGRLSEAKRLKARGKISIREGSISGNRYQDIVYRLTGQDRLRNIKFDQARAAFTFSRQVFKLTSFLLHSYRVKVTSSGSVDTRKNNHLKFTVALHFHRDLVKDIKPKELCYALDPDPSDQDYRRIEFHLWGEPGRVKSDYQQVLLRKGASAWLKSELFKDKKRKDEKERGEESSAGKDDREKMLEDGINLLFKVFQ